MEIHGLDGVGVDTMDPAANDNADSDLICPQCGAESVTTFWHHDTFNYGSGDAAVTLHVDLPVRHCSACDFEFLDDEGHMLRHEAVCRHLGVLTPTEIRAIRKGHEMTRTAFAHVTGFGEATLNRWENGAKVQNRANDRFLRLLAAPEVMASLQRLAMVVDPQPPSVRRDQFRVLNVTERRRGATGNDSETRR